MGSIVRAEILTMLKLAYLRQSEETRVFNLIWSFTGIGSRLQCGNACRRVVINVPGFKNTSPDTKMFSLY